MERIDLPAKALLPHREPMLLIDRALEADEDFVSATAMITSETIFVTDGQMPAHCLLEYMAQTMGLWACWNAKKKNLSPPVGFLLGTRSLKLAIDSIAVGTTLSLTAQRIYVSEEGLAQFDCVASIGDQLVAQAKINAYQPPNANSLVDL